MAASAASQALVLMASEMPDTCSQRVRASSASGRSDGVIRAAALPARRWLN